MKKKKKDVAPRTLLVALVIPIAESLVEPANPAYYKLVSLNEHCDNKENQRELWNATQIKSAAIVTATQFRDGRGRHEYGCSMKLFTKHATGLIVSFVEMNLRAGELNGSCISLPLRGDQIQRRLGTGPLRKAARGPARVFPHVAIGDAEAAHADAAVVLLRGLHVSRHRDVVLSSVSQ